jgi:heme exporter protein D
LLFVWAVVSLALAGLILAAFVSLHDRRALREHYKKLANLDSWVSRDDEA